jgi:hypothetical protein
LHCSLVRFLCQVGHSAQNLLENIGAFLSHSSPYVLDFGRLGPPLPGRHRRGRRDCTSSYP